MTLSGLPNITYTDDIQKQDEYKSQLSALTMQIDMLHLFDDIYTVSYINPWRVNSDDITVSIAYEALIENNIRYFNSIESLLNQRKI
jgi:hypothetical protein